MADILRLQAHVKEHLTRQYLQKKKDWVFSPDWIIKPSNKNNNKIVFVEVKMKTEKFGRICSATKWLNGGHGFDYNQVLNYMKIYANTGIRTLLIIYDESDKRIYEQYLDVLEKSPNNERYVFFSKKDMKKIVAWKINNFIDVGEYER